MKSFWTSINVIRKLHRDQRGAVSLETILIVAAIALPILIFLIKVGWPRIRSLFFQGIEQLEAEGENAAGA